jgi:hypothetical protein
MADSNQILKDKSLIPTTQEPDGSQDEPDPNAQPEPKRKKKKQ